MNNCFLEANLIFRSLNSSDIKYSWFALLHTWEVHQGYFFCGQMFSPGKIQGMPFLVSPNTHTHTHTHIFLSIWGFLVVVAVQSLSRVQFFASPWTAARQASLCFTISWSLLRFVSIESVMLSNHLILCHSLLLLPSVFPSISSWHVVQ